MSAHPYCQGPLLFSTTCSELRKVLNISQKQLSEQIRYNVRALRKFENGHESNNIFRVMRMSKLIHCYISEFVKNSNKSRDSFVKLPAPPAIRPDTDWPTYLRRLESAVRRQKTENLFIEQFQFIGEAVNGTEHIGMSPR